MRTMNFKLSLALVLLSLMAVASCGNEEPEGVESYYITIESQVPLNIREGDENQGTMGDDGANDVLSNTVSRMKYLVQAVQSPDKSRQENDAAVIGVCDSIYNAYVHAYGKMERVIVCHVKVYRTKTVHGIQQYNKALKTYQFWLVEEKPGPQPTEKIEKPDCLAQVDLGLSVNWANCNLGSQTVEGFGGHYAWGDPTGKLWSGTGIGYDVETRTYSWNTENYGGINPPSDISGSALDIVTANWGDGWRMPTYSEAKELCENCQWKLRTYGEIKRYEVIGPNGNSIIIPLAGFYGDDLSNRFYAGPYQTNTMAYFWTSTICPTPASAEARGYAVKSSVQTAWMFFCNSKQGDVTSAYGFIDFLRAYHMSIRAVHDK